MSIYNHVAPGPHGYFTGSYKMTGRFLLACIDVLTNSDHWFLKNIAKTTGFAFLKVTCMKTNY